MLWSRALLCYAVLAFKSIINLVKGFWPLALQVVEEALALMILKPGPDQIPKKTDAKKKLHEEEAFAFGEMDARTDKRRIVNLRAAFLLMLQLSRSNLFNVAASSHFSSGRALHIWCYIMIFIRISENRSQSAFKLIKTQIRMARSSAKFPNLFWSPWCTFLFKKS